ncbi:MAG TPA: hypothetical protein VFE05_06125 [Longimicrobiaceae bacterium]|jgi:hypothetical protein|nr:hypothetical protein [Longimicrobiaceae bacterium]
MRGILFESQGPDDAPAPNRADVALFVGFAGRRPGALPPRVRAWLDEAGWSRGPYRKPARQLNALLDVPVLVDSWETFDQLYAWDARVMDAEGTLGASYLGAAVRSFFAQGGRRCYVVRAGKPWRYTAGRALRLGKLERLIPGISTGISPSPADRGSWRGMGHLFGLPDVSFLCLPDLVDAVRPNPAPPAAVELPPEPEEVFVDCSANDAPPADDPDKVMHRFRAPRCDDAAFRDWARAVRAAGTIVAARAREVQLVASVPIPRPDTVAVQAGERFAAGDDLLRYLLARRWLREGLGDGGRGISSAFVQLAYPWVRTPISGRLPDGVEPPEGALAGVLARNALTRGSYRSAGGQDLGDVWDLYPRLGRGQVDRPQPLVRGSHEEAASLADRVTIFGYAPGGFQLFSDVTTALDESYRPASINRLVSAIVKAARRQGEATVFESSGPAVWAQLEDRLEGLMMGLLRSGALRGASPADAFQVRCDRSTMSQNDLDNGRVIATVAFQPSAPVERIRVVLAMEEGGSVALAPAAAQAEDEAA